VPGLGVIVNIGAVLAGTALGLGFGHLIPERFRGIAMSAIGLATFTIGIQMATGTKSPLILVGSLVLGALTGEAIRIEYWLDRFGQLLRDWTARSPIVSDGPSSEPDAAGHRLIEGFVTASLLYCVGAMTILGSIKDGLGDPSLLYLKALLDGIASVALASTLGIGVGFSVIPILVIQGSIAAGAGLVQPFMTPAVIRELTAAGGVLIFAIGLDLMRIKRLPVGNMLPAIVYAGVLAAVIR
jgi:uncharacterized protein